MERVAPRTRVDRRRAAGGRGSTNELQGRVRSTALADQGSPRRSSSAGTNDREEATMKTKTNVKAGSIGGVKNNGMDPQLKA
ncbi:MAG: hypothetical protein R3B09_35245 [Nannocystaceae bacterium]